MIWLILVAVAGIVLIEHMSSSPSPGLATDPGAGSGGDAITLQDSNGNNYTVDSSGNLISPPSGASQIDGEWQDADGIPLVLFPGRPQGGDP